VEPDNRLVARELEKAWETALRQHQQLEEEHARAQQIQLHRITDQQRLEIEMLATNISSLWHCNTTTSSQRKAVIRHLVEAVSINVDNNSDLVDLRVQWVGSFESVHTLHRSVQRYDQMRDYRTLRKRLIELRKSGRAADEIAEHLNREGYHTARGKAFQAITVQTLLSRADLTADKNDLQGEQLPSSDRWSIPQLVNKVHIPTTTICHWCRRRWLQCCKTRSNRWVIWADADELQRLRRLHAYYRRNKQEEYPAELTTPKPLPGAT
jgi:hypothetical protein